MVSIEPSITVRTHIKKGLVGVEGFLFGGGIRNAYNLRISCWTTSFSRPGMNSLIVPVRSAFVICKRDVFMTVNDNGVVEKEVSD